METGAIAGGPAVLGWRRSTTALWRGLMYGSEGGKILDQSTGTVEGDRIDGHRLRVS